MQDNIGVFLANRARRSPNQEALVDLASGERFDFQQLNRRVNALADALRGRGINKGDRVGLLMFNCTEFVEGFYALAKLGAVVVPLNWRLVPDELSFILKDSGTTALIYGIEFAEAAADIQARGAEGSDISQWFEVGPADERQVFALDYAAELAAGSPIEPDVTSGDDDVLFIMYTSGTTGLPKGVVHTHTTMMWAMITISATSDVREADRYVIVLPMYHVGALTPVLAGVYLGGSTIMMRQFDPAAMWQVLEDEKATSTLAVPAMLNFMLMVPDLDKRDISNLRWIMSGASPVPAALIEKYAGIGIEIHQVYGLTECAGPGCVIATADAMDHIGSTGKAFFHTEVRVIDEDGKDMPPGEPGEVVLRGRHNMVGYWNNPEATAQAIRGGWLHTGDVAVIDQDGFVTIQDRIKDMIISGGENVYPAEVENVILQHAGVAETAVIGQPSAAWGESPLAVVVRKEDGLSAADILKHCDGKLARYKLPKGVEFVDEIPRNPTGKPLKRILREQFPGPAPE